jgi:hypothetical protein
MSAPPLILGLIEDESERAEDVRKVLREPTL